MGIGTGSALTRTGANVQDLLRVIQRGEIYLFVVDQLEHLILHIHPLQFTFIIWI